MGKTGNAALLGGSVALAVGLRDYRRRMNSDLEYATDQSQNALDLARGNATLLSEMLANGDMLRLADDSVSDLLTGLAYPDQTPNEVPSAFASAPVTFSFPDLSEALAISPNQWPGATNAYGPDGKLTQPSTALIVGQNAALGVAFGNAAVRALLMGITQKGDQPTVNQKAQIFRFARSLVQVLSSFENSPLSLANLTTAWQRFLGTPAAPGLYGPGIYFSNVAAAGLLASFTAETAIYSVPVPAGLLSVGEFARVKCLGSLGTVGGGATLTLRARLDSTTGPVLLQSTAMTNAGAEPFSAAVELGRQADVGGIQAFAVTPLYSTGSATESSITGVAATQSFSHTVDHTIVFTAQASASDPATRVQGQACFGQKF